MFSFGITKYFSENIIIRNLVMSKCTAEPTLLCTFSVVSLFSNTIFCIFANRNYYMYALKWHKDS